MPETHPLGDFIPPQMKYLLLGSFAARGMDTDPDYDWYYGSRFNQFWKIIAAVYNRPLLDKAAKAALFTQLQIGISDIIYQCIRERNNSLDTNLKNIVYNPQLTNIVTIYQPEKIFFTSRFVESHYRRVFKQLVTAFPNVELITLPSPSPRFARMSKEEKIKRYGEVLPKLRE